ncbi:hypothetical protein BOX15_Mlig000918g1, partial [Macrostomum lignano]
HQMEHSLRICSIDVVTEANQNNFLLPRQVAVDIDDDLTVTMQLCDTRLFNLAYASSPAGQDDTGVAAFKEKFNLFTQKELADSLMGSSDDLGSAAISVIGCVGCRRAVEAFLGHVGETGEPALDPVQLRGKTISLHSDWFASATRLHYLLEVVRRVLECRVTAGGKAKKGRRCAMHGLDAHKTGRTSWKELWDVMTTECRAELGLVSFESLEDTLDAHLVRHKFCRECRAKVERAFAMMIGDEAPDNTYKPAVFAFVRVCKERGHLHLLPDKTATDTLYELVDRAEPELLQSNPRERHAQTMDAAQEEVLTCIGLHLYNRLTHLAHTLRSDEQTWLLSLLLCLEQLRQGLESAVEKKRGYSSLDLFYWQLEREEKVAEQRREAKREKRRQKRQNKRAAVGNGATDEDGADTATDSVVTIAPVTQHLTGDSETTSATNCDNKVDEQSAPTSQQQQQPPPRPSDHSPRSSGGSNGGGNGGAASSASSSSCSTSHNSSGFSETEECSATGGRSVGGSVRRQRTTGNQTQRQQQKPSSMESVANGAQTTQCDRQRPLSSSRQDHQQQPRPNRKSAKQTQPQQQRKQPQQKQQQQQQQQQHCSNGCSTTVSKRNSNNNSSSHPGCYRGADDSGCDEPCTSQLLHHLGSTVGSGGGGSGGGGGGIPEDVVEDFLKHRLEIGKQREELRRRLRQQWAEKVNSGSLPQAQQ